MEGGAREFLREEQKNRELKAESRGGLFECLSQDVFQDLFDDFPFAYKSVMSRKEVKAIFTSILHILDNTGNVPARAEDETENKFKTRLAECYDSIINTCSDIKPYSKFLHVHLFAIATFIGRPIYVLQRDEARSLSWRYFPFLYSNPDAAKEISTKCITLFFSDDDCYVIDSTRSDNPEPECYGRIGMYIKLAQGVLLRDDIIKRSVHLMTDHVRRPEVKAKLPHVLSMEMITMCTNLCWYERTSEINDSPTNSEDWPALPNTPEKDEFVETLLTDKRLMECLYKVSLKHKEGFRIWENMDLKEDFSAKDFRTKILQLENTVMQLESFAQDVITICRTTTENLSNRRAAVNKSVIGSSSVGLIGGILATIGLALSPVTLGTSLGLTITGAFLGAAGSLTGGFYRAREGVQQNASITDVKKMVEEQIAEQENNMIKLLNDIESMIEANNESQYNHSVKGPGRNMRGFLAIGSAFRSFHSVAGLAIAGARVGATGATIAASVLGPISMVLDIGFFAEAAHNLRKGNKTGAGEILEQNARVIEMKMNLFNCILRGNRPSLEWIID